MAQDNIFSPLIQAFKIIGWITAPLILLSQLQQIAKADDKISRSMRTTNYILNIKKGDKTYKYKFTKEDILNLLRSVHKEGKQELAVAYSLVTRFALLYPSTFSNFSTFLKAYVQPISPKWFPNGNKFLERYGEHPTPLELEKAQERIKNSKLTISQIPSYEIELIAEFLSGKTTNPVKTAVHYVTSQADNNDDELMAREKQVEFAKSRPDLDKPIFYQSSMKGNNWFFSTPTSKNITFTITKQVIV